MKENQFTRESTTEKIARLMRHVVIAGSGCWEWSGALDRHGYGKCTFRAKQMSAHRMAYTLLIGDVDPGLDLDHLCRNTRCVNPAHLEPVTRAENLRRGATARGCKYGHSYADQSNVYYVRRKSGKVERICKTCQLRRNAETRARREMRTAA